MTISEVSRPALAGGAVAFDLGRVAGDGGPGGGVHVWWPVPVWVVWVAGGLTLAAFVAALIHRWRRSVALEEDLF